MPWTKRSRSSASGSSGLFRSASAGATTTSPRRRRRSSRPLASWASSSGKDRTSVGPGSFMNRSWSSAISACSTKEIDSSDPSMPSPRSVSRASSRSSSSSTGRSCRLEIRILGQAPPGTSLVRSSAPGWPSSSIARHLEALLTVTVVRLDDLLDDLVTNDVAATQPAERDPSDPGKDLLDHEQPRRLPPRQVDLGVVPVHDGPRSEPDPREEHLHLLRRRVLRLVQDDERVIQRSAPHERQRRDLHGSSLHQPREALPAGHLEQGVVERTHIRIDLLVEGARQEPEPLPRFDGGSGEDQPRDLTIVKRPDGGGDGG